MRETVYMQDRNRVEDGFDFCYNCNPYLYGEKPDHPYFSVEGEPLEAYYKVEEFYDLLD